MSTAGDRFLASFNYACKLIELPLVTVLAFQLVVCLAFTTIIRAQEGQAECKQKVSLAFQVAWASAFAAIVMVTTFSLPISSLLFGWGRAMVPLK